MTKSEISVLAELLQQGDVDYVNDNLPDNYHVNVETGELPDWIIDKTQWLDIICNELLPVAKERSLSIREIMNRYTNGGSEFGWPEELPWNVEFNQDDPRLIMHQALIYIDEDDFPKSVFECQ